MIRAILLVLGLAGAASAGLSCDAAPGDTPRDTPAAKKVPITEISLQQTTNGWGGGSAYILTVRADSTANFEGKQKAAREGNWKGTISKANFDRLVQTLRDSNFPNIKAPDAPPPTDQARTIISAFSGGKWQSAYAEAGGSAEFQKVAQALRAEIERIQWTKDETPQKKAPDKK